MKTFKKFNGSDFFIKEGVQKTLDYYDPNKNSDAELLAKFKKRPIAYVAETETEIVGIIRGTKERITSLFVDEKVHKQGLGKRLVTEFEKEARSLGSKKIKVRASLNAVSFYEKMKYKKTTGIRNFVGLKIYNVKKKFN